MKCKNWIAKIQIRVSEMLQVSYGIFKLGRLVSMHFQFLILEKLFSLLLSNQILELLYMWFFHVVLKLVELVF